MVAKSAKTTGMRTTLRGLGDNWTVAQWSKLLSSDGSKFCIGVSQCLEEDWRCTESELPELQ